MRVLVTGGCGFIGHHFVKFALNHPSKQYEFIENIDNLSYSAINDSLGDEFFQLDICEQKTILNHLKTRRIDTVVHFAAHTHVDRSIQDARPFLQNNVYGTHDLLDVCKQHIDETGHKLRFVYISTDEVYGSLNPMDKPSLETDAIKPTNPYSASKAAAEHFVQAWTKTYSLPAIITRSCNNYGSGQHCEKLIPKIINNALNWKPIPIYGNGLASREWLHVQDHCEAIHALLTSDIEFSGQIYNITSSESFTNIEVANLICEHMDQLVPHKNGSYKQLIEFADDRPGHDMRYAINSDKLKAQTGWTAKKSFQDSIDELIQNERERAEALSHKDLPQARRIEHKSFPDQRGSVSPRIFSSYDEQAGAHLVQENLTHSFQGVIRGLHFQRNKPQAKLIEVLDGEILDVVLDIRPHSQSFGKCEYFNLKQGQSIIVPAGYAHGYLTLSSESYVMYKLSEFWDPLDQNTILFNDKDLGINWAEYMIPDKFILSKNDKEGMTWAEFLKTI